MLTGVDLCDCACIVRQCGSSLDVWAVTKSGLCFPGGSLFMSVVTSAAITLALYGSSVLQLWRRLRLPSISGCRIQLLTAAGVLAQGWNCFWLINTSAGIDLNLFALASLCSWALVLMVLLGSLRRPVHNLLFVVLPLGMMATAAATWLRLPAAILPNYSAAMLIHVILSILACSLLTAAAIQSLLLACQERVLKRRQAPGLLVRALPPLQTMENLLFEFLWVGLFLLSVGLVSGLFCLQDIFARHLVHKTLLALLSWMLFAILLTGRLLAGWRGRTAIRWTLGGFALLMLAFFGSKLTLNFVYT